jgi:hypothetical protein
MTLAFRSSLHKILGHSPVPLVGLRKRAHDQRGGRPYPRLPMHCYISARGVRPFCLSSKASAASCWRPANANNDAAVVRVGEAAL